MSLALSHGRLAVDAGAAVRAQAHGILPVLPETCVEGSRTDASYEAAGRH